MVIESIQNFISDVDYQVSIDKSIRRFDPFCQLAETNWIEAQQKPNLLETYRLELLGEEIDIPFKKEGQNSGLVYFSVGENKYYFAVSIDEDDRQKAQVERLLLLPRQIADEWDIPGFEFGDTESLVTLTSELTGSEYSKMRRLLERYDRYEVGETYILTEDFKGEKPKKQWVTKYLLSSITQSNKRKAEKYSQARELFEAFSSRFDKNPEIMKDFAKFSHSNGDADLALDIQERINRQIVIDPDFDQSRSISVFVYCTLLDRGRINLVEDELLEVLKSEILGPEGLNAIKKSISKLGISTQKLDEIRTLVSQQVNKFDDTQEFKAIELDPKKTIRNHLIKFVSKLFVS